MKLPKRIQLLGYRIRVIQKDIDEHGLCDRESKTIIINETDSLDVQLSTLFHEMLHMVLYLTGSGNLLTDKEEETIVSSIENGLWPLLRKTWK